MNESLLIVRDPLIMSVIELSNSPVVEVLVAFMCPFLTVSQRRGLLDETIQLLPTVVNLRYANRRSLRPPFREWPCVALPLRDSIAVQCPVRLLSLGVRIPPDSTETRLWPGLPDQNYTLSVGVLPY